MPAFDPELIRDLFESTSKNPSISWDVYGVCRWDYFFLADGREELAALAEVLVSMGYGVVGISAPENEDEGKHLMLHVIRDEAHTVESLLERNEELAAIAAEAGVLAYDGMEVGPVPEE